MTKRNITRRPSKIDLLPSAIRAELEALMIDQGQTYAEICEKLKDKHSVDLNPTNLYKWWKQHGPKALLQVEQERLDAIASLLEDMGTLNSVTRAKQLRRHLIVGQLEDKLLQAPDVAQYVAMEGVRLQQEKLELEKKKVTLSRKEYELAREKWEFDAASAALDASEDLAKIQKSTVPRTEQIAAVRARLFGKAVDATPSSPA